MFLLQEKNEVPALFTEMSELTRANDNNEEWRETARWVKFEEDVEIDGNRWSKPHVATLSLHALFQLRLYYKLNFSKKKNNLIQVFLKILIG